LFALEGGTLDSGFRSRDGLSGHGCEIYTG
jgi:hypothetical protein